MDELGKTLSIFSFVIISVIGLVGVVQGKTFLSMFNIGYLSPSHPINEIPPTKVTTMHLG